MPTLAFFFEIGVAGRRAPLSLDASLVTILVCHLFRLSSIFFSTRLDHEDSMADEGVEGVAAVTSKRSASPEDDAAAASKKPKRSASDEEAGAQTSEQTKLVDGAAASSSASGRDKFFLDSLPCASRYIRSLMHRDTLTFVKVTPHTNFVLTASLDGFVKFWKKQETGVEFVKQYRAHLAPVTGLCVSADGALAASISSDGSCKVFDVVNFGECRPF